MGHSMPLIYLFFAFISEQCYYKTFPMTRLLSGFNGGPTTVLCFFYNGLILTTFHVQIEHFLPQRKDDSHDVHLMHADALDGCGVEK